MIGSGDDAHVHGNRPGAAHRPHLFILQHAQQLRLNFFRHFADLVEEECPTCRGSKDADSVRERAGESAAAIAKQFALDQFSGQGSAIHRNELVRRAATGGMNGARQQFFPGAGLSQ